MRHVSIEHVFDTVLGGEAPGVGAVVAEDWCDPEWGDEEPEPEEPEHVSVAQCVPSGWLALELDQCTADPAVLSDADLIDAIVGFDRIGSWAGARQAKLLAEFAARRPEENSSLPSRSELPSRYSEYAADEVGLALRLSRAAAANRLATARALVEELPATLSAWQSGTIDVRKAQAIAETSEFLEPEQRGVLEDRVLPRAGVQTLARLRAALARAVLMIDPHGAARRHEQRRADRRVVVRPDSDGMASLWALLSAPDATAAYQRLGQLARTWGAEDSRGMDARRADLLVDLLTGRRCAATGTCAAPDCDGGTPTSTERDHRRPSRPRGPATPLVSVVVPITMLMGLDEHPGELLGYGPIPAPLAREIAAQGTWRRLLTDPATGALLDHGRTTYTPPAALADYVRARDMTCRHPTCGQRAVTADLDHTIAWPDGPTSADNLHASCRRHHRIKTHTPGWHVDQHPDATITWTTPTGHAYASQPHDYRTDPRPPPDTGPPGTTPGHDQPGMTTGQDPPGPELPDLDPPPF